MSGQKPRVILAYKNFAAHKHISHIGLGVAACKTQQTLLKEGIHCDVWAVVSSDELRKRLNLEQANPSRPRITHVVISAPWIQDVHLRSLCNLFPEIQFTVSSHSNVGFLQADANGMRHYRKSIHLANELPNFHVAGNSERFVRWVNRAYDCRAFILPNLYSPGTPAWDRDHKHRTWKGGVLKVGVFGATRPLKNMMSSVAAAVELQNQMKVDIEVYLNSGRTEGGGNVIIRAIKEMVDGVPGINLREVGWCSHSEFLEIVKRMHVLFQPSYTESFNMVTADGIVAGVPSVVSQAIPWAPRDWEANIDDVFDIAQTARQLLFDDEAAHEGLIALRTYVERGIPLWKTFLDSTIHPRHRN